jgi:hypothetical protein
VLAAQLEEGWEPRLVEKLAAVKVDWLATMLARELALELVRSQELMLELG